MTLTVEGKLQRV